MAIRKPDVSTVATQIPELEPARILEIELDQPLSALSALDEKTGRLYRRALCLIRLHTQPLGVVMFKFDEQGISASACAQHIWHCLSAEINAHLRQDSLPLVTELNEAGVPSSTIPRCLEERERFLAQAPFVSVIVSTRDRPEWIQSCLRSLLTLRYPHYEVIVVDNAPKTSATADYIQQTYSDTPQIRYIREDRPGLSWARNCGINAAKGEILAFTDDDVVVDTYWLVELIRAFSVADNVAGVTGMILPLELETPAQFWFEEYIGLSWTPTWFSRRILDGKRHVYLVRPGEHGGGANMAFTASFLRSVGGFDPALGAGRKAGGEDHAALFQVIVQGHKLVHEPASLVYHLHRRDYPALQKQIYHYGTGFTAYLIKSILDNPQLLLDLVTKLPFDFISTLNSWLSKNRKKSSHYPKELNRLELQGRLYGPLGYIQSRWEVRSKRETRARVEVMDPSIDAKETHTLRHDIYDQKTRAST
jgi:glycosyltransferase involved in cell wall biosynthesis